MDLNGVESEVDVRVLVYQIWVRSESELVADKRSNRYLRKVVRIWDEEIVLSWQKSWFIRQINQHTGPLWWNHKEPQWIVCNKKSLSSSRSPCEHVLVDFRFYLFSKFSVQPDFWKLLRLNIWKVALLVFDRRSSHWEVLRADHLIVHAEEKDVQLEAIQTPEFQILNFPGR